MREVPLFDVEPLIAVAEPPPDERPGTASQLGLDQARPADARRYVAAWHSRLPNTQVGPWKLAFTASHREHVYGAALWHNPSARMLPQEWLELRRLAIAPWAPHCSASWMLGAMRRWIAKNLPDVPRLASYQDTEVHTGTIYRAAGWTPAYAPTPIRRNRRDVRAGTRRFYRSDMNGDQPASVAKVRWEITP